MLQVRTNRLFRHVIASILRSKKSKRLMINLVGDASVLSALREAQQHPAAATKSHMQERREEDQMRKKDESS